MYSVPSDEQRAVLAAIGLHGAMPEELRAQFPDEHIAALVRAGYAKVCTITLQETGTSRVGPAETVSYYALTGQGAAASGHDPNLLT